MGALSVFESWFLLASAVVSVGVAIWSAGCSFGSARRGTPTGELAWALVAAALLVGVGAVVWSGSSHAG